MISMSEKLLDMKYGDKYSYNFLKFFNGKVISCPKCNNRVLLNSNDRLLSNGEHVNQYKCQNCSFIFYPNAKFRKHDKEKKKKLVYY